MKYILNGNLNYEGYIAPLLRFIGMLLLILGLVVSISFGLLFYLGGYWENCPILNRVSGPKRFRQFVVDPIPPYVGDIRGGYSGFPRGSIVTRFSLELDSSSWTFLTEWVSVECASEIQYYVPELMGGQVYRKDGMSGDECGRGPFLVIDKNSARGALVLGAG